jgi:hypothetical protein
LSGCNFCIYENKVFDMHGNEIKPDEDNIVSVIFNGVERRFVVDKMINFLKEGGYNSVFREPKKIAIPKEPKTIAKIVKDTKEKKPTYKKVDFDKRKLGNDNGFPKKKVLCSNGKVYNSLHEASKLLKINKTGIFNCCQGRYKQTKGYSFVYFENK